MCGFLPLLAALALVPATPLQAATDAGALRQQLERDQLRPLPRQGVPEVLVPAEPPSPRRGNALTISGFRFSGNTLVASVELEAVLEPYRQRALEFSEIEALTAVVAARYRARGYLASVVLPAQDVSDGTLSFLVLEAVLGKVLVEANPPSRTVPSQIQGRVAAQLPEGTFLQAQALDRALLIAGDLPGVAVTGALAEGAAPGQTDLLLHVEDTAPVTGDAVLDNAGGASTGSDRVSLNMYGNGLLGQGDLWTGNVVANQGSTYARVSLGFPMGYDGLRMGVNTSHLQYQVITADYSSLGLEGSSAVWGLEASYPLVRAQRENLYLGLALDEKRFLNYAAKLATSDYRSLALSWSLYGNRFDDLAGGGATSGNLTLSQGHLQLEGAAQRATDALSTQTAGDYRKLRYSLARQQSITDALLLLVSLSGQWTDQNLDSSERFSLGGSTGVRAYPGDEGAGAIGRVASAELRWQASAPLVWSAFFDSGTVTVNARNDYNGASALNSYALSGAGLALAWQVSRRTSARLTWARRQGDNPNPTSTGRDQDGTRVLDRVWASVAMGF